MYCIPKVMVDDIMDCTTQGTNITCQRVIHKFQLGHINHLIHTHSTILRTDMTRENHAPYK